ncbi:hypothetical protein GALMADRAFT_139653 [Galerina marginata CBS 339.88]|uniref:Uncharacterized protein n=1 Tax=Galerina marginata (strain CBS 339.88) TaxID=685588 RepID=A0A067T0U8_GALM3|nr:hypothetical protein GALMADRAFT_139653 [Galerina marginata CBS 339.88]
MSPVVSQVHFDSDRAQNSEADSMDLFELTDIESDNEVPNVKDRFPVVQEDSIDLFELTDTESDNEVPEATAVPEVNAISEIKTETVSRYVDAIIERHAMQPGAKIYHPPPEAKFNRNRNVDGRLSVPASPVAADENPIQVTDIELDSTTCGSNFDPPVVFSYTEQNLRNIHARVMESGLDDPTYENKLNILKSARRSQLQSQLLTLEVLTGVRDDLEAVEDILRPWK